jgi:hypothetical protein
MTLAMTVTSAEVYYMTVWDFLSRLRVRPSGLDSTH